MLLRLLFAVIACGVLAVSRVLIVKGDPEKTPTILSLLPVHFGSIDYGACATAVSALPSTKEEGGRGGGGEEEEEGGGSNARKGNQSRRTAEMDSLGGGGGSNARKGNQSRRTAEMDSLDATGARGLQAFRRSLRSRFGVYAGRVNNFRAKIVEEIKLPRFRRAKNDGDGASRGPGQFAERLLRQLVNRAHQLSEATYGVGVDQRYVDLIRALEVEGDKALGAEDWKEVAYNKDDEVKVWKRATPDGTYGKEYPCVKLATILHAPANVIMDLLVDSDRVGEYNKYSKGRLDIEILGSETKIVRNRTLPPLTKKPHEFCTLMHVLKKEDGSQVMLTRFTEHPKAPKSSNYVRSEIILGVTQVKPHPMDPKISEFVTVSHVKSAGVPPFIAEQFSVKGVVDFTRNLESTLEAKGALQKPKR